MENEGDPREFWAQIKPWCKDLGPTDRGSIELINEVEDAPYDEDKVPNVFNKFFSNIGLELKQKVNELNESEKKVLSARMEENSVHHGQPPPFYFRQTNEIELLKLIKRIKIHKASGIPRVSSHLLKLCFGNMVPQTVHLINQSLDTITIPSHCKNAVITPVFKAGG